MRPFRFDFPSMGCPCSLQLEAADEATASRAAALARAEVARLDDKYSHYRDDNWLSLICASAGGQGIEVDDETANLLDFAATMHTQSAGRFDITAGGLTRLWDSQHGGLPTHEEIDAGLALVGWHRVEWRRPLLRLPLPGMRLDLGGIVKEYAADRASQQCRDAGVEHGVVDLGGDLALIGAHADGAPWLVGIKAPRDPARACATIALARGALATSGDYERALVIDGRRYSHIVDPRSGWPVAGFASVSVMADACLVAGAAATLAMLLGVEEGAAYLEELALPYLCIDQYGRRSGSIENG